MRPDKSYEVKSRRAFYFERQGGLCALRLTANCQARAGQMVLILGKMPVAPPPNTATFDHLTPRSVLKGKGTAERHNVVLACRECNGVKSSSTDCVTEELRALAVTLWEAYAVHRQEKAAEFLAAADRALMRRLRRMAMKPCPPRWRRRADPPDKGPWEGMPPGWVVRVGECN